MYPTIIIPSMNEVLCKKAVSFIPKDWPIIIKNGDPRTHFYELKSLDIKTKWAVNVDEDCFVIDPVGILRLIDQMERDGYDAAGIQDGSSPMRSHNPVVFNPFFWVFNVAKVQAAPSLSLDVVVESQKFSHLVRYKHLPYEYDNFEPYYSFFIDLLHAGFRPLFLSSIPFDGYQHDEYNMGKPSVLLGEDGKELAIHSWYARGYSSMPIVQDRIKVCEDYANSKKVDFDVSGGDKSKLKGFPPVFYINLDDHAERKEYMEGQFRYWGVEEFTRISACDGRKNDLSKIIEGRMPDTMEPGEIGCVLSHLKALKFWLETSDSPCAIIMEDDTDLDTIKHWKFTWQDFISKVPYDYDVIQFVICNPGRVFFQLHRRFINDFSTGCYLITRHHAQKLMRYHLRGGRYKLDNGVKPRPTAENVIYNCGNTFSIPLLIYKIDFGSAIHAGHVNDFHRSSYDGLWYFWRNDTDKIEDWNAMFDYDPNFGRLPPGFKGNNVS